MVEEANGRLDRLSQGHFDLLVNAANELMIIFNRVKQEAKNPLFIYDGRASAFLCKKRGRKADKVFTELPKEAWDVLNSAKNILCVEVDQDHIYTEYMADVEVKH